MVEEDCISCMDLPRSKLFLIGSVIEYDPSCPSVGRSVGWFVSRSVGWSRSVIISNMAGGNTFMLLLEHLIIIWREVRLPCSYQGT